MPVGAAAHVQSGRRIPISVTHPYRYYLMWMTALPPGSQTATIADLNLYR